MKEWYGDRRDFLKLSAVLLARFLPLAINETVTKQAVLKLDDFEPPKGRSSPYKSVLFGGWYGEDIDKMPKHALKMSSILTTFPMWNENSWVNGKVWQIIKMNRLPMISVGPTYQKFSETNSSELVEIFVGKLSGLEDEEFLLRPYYEFNGDWMGYGSKVNLAHEFKTLWQKIVPDIKKNYPKAKLVWSPNVRYPILPYFPGDEFVDIVALDGYNKAELVSVNDRVFQPNLSFEQLFGPDLRLVSELTNKPIMISEIGVSAYHPEALSWIQNAFNRATEYGVRAVCGFWETKSGIGETDWNWLTNPGAINILRQILRENTAYYIDVESGGNLMEKLYN